MKKIIISTVFVLSFAGYVLYQFANGSSQGTLATNENTNPTPVKNTVPSGSNNATKGTTNSASNSGSNVSQGLKDGEYVGDVVFAYSSNLQVKAVVSQGKLSDVVYLIRPADSEHTIEINNKALPILRSEAIAVQSVNVDVVSGATASSRAFTQSLASALKQAN